MVVGLQGAWALSQYLECLEAEDQVKAVQSMLMVLVTAYVAQGTPRLARSTDLPLAQYNLELNAREQFWNHKREALLARDMAELDEHVIKLIQVLSEMSERLSPNHELQPYIMLAADTVLDKPFFFADPR